jgi:hypothetical protein
VIGDNAWRGVAPFVQTQSPRGYLLNRHLMEHRTERVARASVLGREAQPDVGFDQIDRNPPSFGIGKSKIILSENIPLLGFSAKLSQISILGLKRWSQRHDETQA